MAGCPHRRRTGAVRAGVALVTLSLAVGLGACGDDSDGGAASQTSTSDSSPSEPSQPSRSEPPTSDAAEPVVIDVTIADGTVTPAGETVEAEVGQEIEVHVASDAADELHVHSSPEHEFEIEPGRHQLFTFSIDQPGQVEIETHETETVVAELVVTG